MRRGGVAEAALGKQAEILAQGDLALNGRDQMLVVNRFSRSSSMLAVRTNTSAIFVTRAAVLEQNGGKWSEVLLCDEHLKNPNGYLGGSPAARVTGWRLEYRQDPKEGLEMKFTPAEDSKRHTGTRVKVPSTGIRLSMYAGIKMRNAINRSTSLMKGI